MLKEETNPLIWLSIDEDYTDRERFAGEQNIAHIINVAFYIPCPKGHLLKMDFILAVTVAMHAHGVCEIIPEKPEEDSKGLKMQMFVLKSLLSDPFQTSISFRL